MEICDNPSCQVWMHEECLIDDILTKTYKRLVKDSASAEPGTNGAPRPNGKKEQSQNLERYISGRNQGRRGGTHSSGNHGCERWWP